MAQDGGNRPGFWMQMPELTGVQVLTHCQIGQSKGDTPPPTRTIRRALEGYELDVVDYLLQNLSRSDNRFFLNRWPKGNIGTTRSQTCRPFCRASSSRRDFL